MGWCCLPWKGFDFSTWFSHPKNERCVQNDRRRGPVESSTRSLSTRRLSNARAYENQRRFSGHHQSQEFPEADGTALTQPPSQADSSIRRIEPSSDTVERSLSVAKAKTQPGQGVLRVLESLKSSVPPFVDRSISNQDKFLRSEICREIYWLIIDNATRRPDSESSEAIANKIEGQFKKIDQTLRRQRTELLSICEQSIEMRTEITDDPGSWNFKWRREDKDLEFPDALRDGDSFQKGSFLLEASGEDRVD